MITQCLCGWYYRLFVRKYLLQVTCCASRCAGWTGGSSLGKDVLPTGNPVPRFWACGGGSGQSTVRIDLTDQPYPMLILGMRDIDQVVSMVYKAILKKREGFRGEPNSQEVAFTSIDV